MVVGLVDEILVVSVVEMVVGLIDMILVVSVVGMDEVNDVILVVSVVGIVVFSKDCTSFNA